LANDVNNCNACGTTCPSPQNCYASVCGIGACSGLCTNPTLFTGPAYTANDIVNTAACFETRATLSGGTCGGTSARTFSVNGTVIQCNGNWPRVPAASNGGYCIQLTAGASTGAWFTTW
jgi:hypothetical protein